MLLPFLLSARSQQTEDQQRLKRFTVQGGLRAWSFGASGTGAQVVWHIPELPASEAPNSSFSIEEDQNSCGRGKGWVVSLQRTKRALERHRCDASKSLGLVV